MTPTNSHVAMSAWLERAWLSRYLDGLLSDDERTWFEEYVLDKSELLIMIDADTRLREAVHGDGRNAGDIVDLSQPPDAPALVPRRSNHAGMRWLAAAALVLGFGIGRIALQSNSNDGLIVNPTHVVYDTMRGDEIPPRVEQADSQSPFVLIEVAVPPGAEKISLRMGTGTQATLLPSPNGFVSFLLSKDQLGSSKEARVDYMLNGQQRSRPITFAELQREK